MPRGDWAPQPVASRAPTGVGHIAFPVRCRVRAPRRRIKGLDQRNLKRRPDRSKGLRLARNGRWPRVSPVPLVLIGAAAALLALAAGAHAADPGQLESISLAVTPAAQGIGGPFEAVLTAKFATDPHATLRVTNLTAEITVPPGLTLLPPPQSDENPARRAQVDLPPTQGFLTLTFRWNLTGTALGNYTLTARVTTDASGGGSRTQNVTVRPGIVIGQVVATPASPTVSDPLRFEVPVTSGYDESTSTLEVWLFIYQTSAPVHPASANGSALRLTSGETVRGAGFPMRAENGTYRFDIPAQARGTLIYWVNAQTPHSNTTTKAVRVLVEDPGVSGAVSAGALAAVLALGAAGTAYIIWDPAGRKPAAGSVHNSPDRVRMAMVVVAVGAAIFVVAVLAGALAGLWGRIGYA